MIRRVLAWCKAIMEAMVEPKRASTPGDMRLPRARAVYVSLLTVVCLSLNTPPVGYLSLNTPPSLVHRTYVVRAKDLAGVCDH